MNPLSICFDQGVGEFNEFPHDGCESDLLRFALFDHAPVFVAHIGVVFDRDESGHVERVAQLFSTTLNRPGFTGERFVQISGDFIKVVHVCIESLLCFLWRDISDGAVQAFGVVPIDPFQGFPFDPADGFPWAEEIDDFGFE